MKFPTLFITSLVTCAIYTEAYQPNNKRQPEKLTKRQTTNADQMVQNILQWLQGVYAQNSRRIRQGTLREYLPPANTEKPRPFGYPPAGYSPETPFPFPTNSATGGFTAPDGYQPDGQNELLPPEHGSGGGENGYVKHEPQPGFTLPTAGPYEGPTPTEAEHPSEKPTSPEEQPGTFTGQPGYTTAVPGYPTSHTTLPNEQPGPFPTHPGLPEGEPSVTTAKQPKYTSTILPGEPEHNGYADTTPGILFTEGTQPGLPAYTSPSVTQIPPEGSTGYPAPRPQPTIGYPTRVPSAEEPTTTLQPEAQPSVSTSISTGPETTLSPHPNEQPEGPYHAVPEGPEPVPSETPGEPAHATTLIPSGFTTSTGSPSKETETPAKAAPSGPGTEGSATTLSPEVNTIPGKSEPVVTDEDLKHPPHIHEIDVQCSKEMMTINIEFNRQFDGVIYSKGFYNNPECRYVQQNSGQSKYTFTVNLAMCGTEFINAFDTQNQSYLENVLVLQNEPGIQEVWDTVRSVRCLWEGNIKDTLSVAFSIGMLSQEIVTFSGDTAMAKLDVVLARGPFGEPANGLVKIGEQMTLVVSVSGDPGFDLQVKDCKAVDSEGKNSVALTDEDGCILKPKLFGAFQKTKETGNSGASIIAYAYFNAFKFPDEMDLMIECNIELCKTDCDMCSKENQQLEPARRRRRDVPYNNTLSDGLIMGKHLRVILPEDINEKTALELTIRHSDLCMSVQSFVFSAAVLISLLAVTSFASICLWLKRGEKKYLKY